MRYVYDALIAILIITTSAFAQEKSLLDEITEKAIVASFEIKLLEAKIEAARSNSIENSNLPDPVLGLSLSNIPVNSFAFDQEPMTGKIVSLSQDFPFPGKLSLKEDFLLSDTKIIEQDVNFARAQLRKNLADSYYTLSYLQNKVRILKDKENLLRALQPVVRTKYEVGKASQQNILLIDLALSDLEEKVYEILGKIEEISSELSLQIDEIFDRDISEVLWQQEPIDYDFQTLIEIAKRNNPSLLKISLLEDKSQKQKDLAEYSFYPDFNLSALYSQRDQLSSGTDLNDFFTLKLGIKLPINYGSKKSAGVRKAEMLKEAYRETFNNSLRMLSIKLNNSISEVNTLASRKQIIEERVLIQSRESFEASLSEYQVGKIDFLNVIESLNKLVDKEDSLNKIRLDLAKEKTRIEFLLGYYTSESTREINDEN